MENGWKCRTRIIEINGDGGKEKSERMLKEKERGYLDNSQLSKAVRVVLLTEEKKETSANHVRVAYGLIVIIHRLDAIL